MNTPTRSRRWFQFGIASLIWMMLVTALAVNQALLQARISDLESKLGPQTKTDDLYVKMLKGKLGNALRGQPGRKPVSQVPEAVQP